MPDFTVKPGVILLPAERKFVAAVAKDFPHPLVVTSGYRGPERQASAMYTKFKVGGSWHIYIQSAAAKAVYEAYAQGVKNHEGRTATVKAMAAVMASQEHKGIFLSRHMRATAIDFRTRNLTHHERKELEEACRKNGAKVILAEGHPVHLHVQF